MISPLELRHIIECGFLPLSCTCTVNPDGSLMVKVFDSESGRVDLLVTGISRTNLTSSRALANLIRELRNEMVSRNASFAQSSRVQPQLTRATLIHQSLASTPRQRT